MIHLKNCKQNSHKSKIQDGLRGHFEIIYPAITRQKLNGFAPILTETDSQVLEHVLPSNFLLDKIQNGGRRSAPYWNSHL